MGATMTLRIGHKIAVATLGLAASLAAAPADARIALDGPQGLVRADSGEPLEGIMVQLVSKKSAIRTTVYSDADGHYAFPNLEAGTSVSYTHLTLPTKA